MTYKAKLVKVAVEDLTEIYQYIANHDSPSESGKPPHSA